MFLCLCEIPKQSCSWYLKCNPFGMVSFFLAIIIRGGSWKYIPLQMTHLDACLKECYLDLIVNCPGMISIEKFPGADPWHPYLTSTLNSPVFLNKNQPEPLCDQLRKGQITHLFSIELHTIFMILMMDFQLRTPQW